MALTIGILSDTHLSAADDLFRAQVSACFADVEIILHAGDLTNPAILSAFPGKRIYAVHGNMCARSAQSGLPANRVLEFGGFTIVLTHGHAYGYNDLEERLLVAFPESDCIVYGHTHRPICHQVGQILFINPGSFTGTGRHGASGTYALLTIGAQLSARILQVGAAG